MKRSEIMDSEETRLVYYPSYCDIEVLTFVNSFKNILKQHKIEFRNTGESTSYYPKEIVQYLDYSGLENAWENGDYRLILERYTSAWIDYAVSIAGIPPYYTVEEFINGTAERELSE